MGNAKLCEKYQQKLQIIKARRFTNDKEITQYQFTHELLKQIDNTKGHVEAGPIFVNDSYLLKRFYETLNNNQPVSKERLIQIIYNFYCEPQESIKHSFEIIQVKNTKPIISKAQFSQYMQKCFERGVERIQKGYLTQQLFRVSFKDWVRINQQKIYKSFETLFQSYAQAHEDLWNYQDFKRWIIAKQNWYICIKIQQDNFKIPLNLPALLGITIFETK